MSSRREQKEQARRQRLEREAHLRALGATIALADSGGGQASISGVPARDLAPLAVLGRLAYGIGIRGAQVTSTPVGGYVGGGTCFYWLHTHAADGIIHIESPVARTYRLGDFFDVWGQQLGNDRVGPVAGPVTALLDGGVYHANPRNIPLTAHAQIQLEVGRPPVAPVSITFPNGL